jgi:hypothetical protein
VSGETSLKERRARERPDGSSSRVGLLDVLRIDVPKIHGAITGQGIDADPAAKLLMRLLEEHRPGYETRVLYCPPLPLLWNFAGGASPAAVAHQAYGRAVWRERGFVGRAGLLSVYLLWPIIVGSMVVWLTALNGSSVKQPEREFCARSSSSSALPRRMQFFHRGTTCSNYTRVRINRSRVTTCGGTKSRAASFVY